jgi:hypothetical protein
MFSLWLGSEVEDPDNLIALVHARQLVMKYLQTR